jgi:hypothetical protein
MNMYLCGPMVNPYDPVVIHNQILQIKNMAYNINITIYGEII